MDKIKKKYRVLVVASRVGYIEVEAEDKEKGKLEAMNHLDLVKWDEGTDNGISSIEELE